MMGSYINYIYHLKGVSYICNLFCGSFHWPGQIKWSYWLQWHVNGCAAVVWLPVLHTTFVEPGQSRPPQLTCYKDTLYRYHVRHEYKQWVILISNVNLFYASSVDHAVWGVCLGSPRCWDRGSNPASDSNNDSVGMTRMKQRHSRTLGFC